MTEFEQAVAYLHWINGISLDEAEALLKGYGIAPLDDEEDA